MNSMTVKQLPCQSFREAISLLFSVIFLPIGWRNVGGGGEVGVKVLTFDANYWTASKKFVATAHTANFNH